MTLEELKAEAKAQGYKLMPIVPYIKLAPCKCGKKYPGLWYRSGGGMFFKCKYCDLSAPDGNTEREARKNWNAMVEGVASCE